MSNQDIPSIPAFQVGNNIYAWCKYCKKWHLHGAGGVPASSDSEFGHRVAHCTNTTPYSDRGYMLENMGDIKTIFKALPESVRSLLKLK